MPEFPLFTCQKLEKSISQYFLNSNFDRKKLPPRSCEKLENLQGSKEYCWWFFLDGKHWNLRVAPKILKKCWKKDQRTGRWNAWRFSRNTCQKLEKSIPQYFLNWNLKTKKLPPKPRSCQTLEKSISQYLSVSVWKEKTAAKTKILPKTGEFTKSSKEHRLSPKFSKNAGKKPTNWKMECLMIFPYHLPKARKINSAILFDLKFW